MSLCADSNSAWIECRRLSFKWITLCQNWAPCNQTKWSCLQWLQKWRPFLFLGHLSSFLADYLTLILANKVTTCIVCLPVHAVRGWLWYRMGAWFGKLNNFFNSSLKRLTTRWFPEVLFHTLKTSSWPRTDITAPQISPSGIPVTPPPNSISRISSQYREPRHPLFGKRMVHLPPRELYGSSQVGFIPSRKKW